MKLVYSSEKKLDVRKQLGHAHYSYGFTADLYVKMLVNRGVDISLVDRPEVFKDRRTYQALLGVDPADVTHISFRSTENIRLMAGARNIFFYYWEFPVLRDRHLVTDAVTADQLHMLRLADELWVSCQFTKTLFEGYGLNRVYTVAPPVCSPERPTRLNRTEALDLLSDVPAVPLTILTGHTRSTNMALCASGTVSLGQHPRLRAIAENGAGRVYLTVCNPNDSRKNLLNVIDGFRLAAGDAADSVLILKLIVSNDANFRSNTLIDFLAPRFRGPVSIIDPRILVVFEFLETRQMTALYSVADFYLSASHCEGLNLPLVEAMARGVVPISTLNTAMVDYIDDDNALIISEKSYPSPVDNVAASVAGRVFDLPIATRFDVAEVVLQAAGMTAQACSAKVEAGWRSISSMYSEDVIFDHMQKRFADVTTRTLA